MKPYKTPIHIHTKTYRKSNSKTISSNKDCCRCPLIIKPSHQTKTAADARSVSHQTKTAADARSASHQTNTAADARSASHQTKTAADARSVSQNYANLELTPATSSISPWRQSF